MIVNVLYNKLDDQQKDRINQLLLDPIFKAFVQGHIVAFQDMLHNLNPTDLDAQKFAMQFGLIRGRMNDWQEFAALINKIEDQIETAQNEKGN